MRPIVTLISDWRIRDPYIAMFKGTLLSYLPDAEIIDISHVVDFFNLYQTAFLTQQSYRQFPEGSVHILLTGVSCNSKASPIVVEHDGHYFIGEDNGIFFMMFNTQFPVKSFQYKGDKKDLMGKIAHLTQAVCHNDKESITEGFDITKFKRLFAPLPLHFPMDRTIEGEIVYIDANFNAITNIPVEMFKDSVQNGSFQAIITSNKAWKCQIYHDTYQPEEEFFLTSNVLGCIEITMYQAKVAILADFKVGDKITINY